MKPKPLLLVCLLTAMGAMAGPADARSRSVIDLLDRTVAVPVHPRRVVSLAPSITEIVYALNRQDRLVGVTQFSDYPPAAQHLPKVGSYIRLDLEKIVALQPDLCLAIRDGNPKVSIDRIEGMGIPVFALDPRDLGSVMTAIQRVGGLLDAAAQADALVTDMQRRIRGVDARVATVARRPRVFFQIGISPIVSIGSGTFIDELIQRAGGDNVARGTVPYPRLSVEQVLALAPEVIIITSMARHAVFEEVKAQWESWPELPAARMQRIYLQESNLFDRPSPRLVEGLELLLEIIHGPGSNGIQDDS
jgi:iron complex transport system substrate-binding protein